MPNISGTGLLHTQNLVYNELERQIGNTLEVGAYYRGSLLYAGIFMSRFVAANVSKETPYLSGW